MSNQIPSTICAARVTLEEEGVMLITEANSTPSRTFVRFRSGCSNLHDASQGQTDTHSAPDRRYGRFHVELTLVRVSPAIRPSNPV